MIRTIDIIGRRGRYDLPTFLLTDNEVLTLKITGVDPHLGRYVATIRHGNETKTVYLNTGMTFDLPAAWLAINGEKPLEIFLELRDNTGTQVLIHSAKSITDQVGFYIEPLKIERVDKNWSLVAWLQRVENNLTNIKRDFNAESQKIKDRMSKVEERLSEYDEKDIPLSVED